LKLPSPQIRLKTLPGQPPFAFVQYGDRDEAKRALAKMDQDESAFGRMIKVQMERAVRIVNLWIKMKTRLEE
jgi:hypothetical protein